MEAAGINGRNMMNADSDILVWLERLGHAQPAVIVPYVRSTSARQLRYRLKATKTGRNGRSVIGQGGNLQVVAGQSAPLGKMTITYGPDDECQVDVILYETGQEYARFELECPPNTS